LQSILDFFKFLSPVHDLWLTVVYGPLSNALLFIYGHVQGIGAFEAIGAYGVAIIVLTVIIRLLLAPLQQFQLVTQRKTLVEQRKLAPQVAELRKKYKKDTQKLNAEMMKLYQEHGVNPLGGAIGCLPLIVQLPILTALYYVFTGFAAATTFIQSKMLQMPPPPNPTEQELQTLQMQRTMVLLSPLMIGYFALNVPAGLGLYWFVGNCVSIIQQSFVVGWGNLLPARFRPVSGGAPSLPARGSVSATGGPKPVPGNGARPGNSARPGNGARPKPGKQPRKKGQGDSAREIR
jgi:YidC/Oxa1 family membrane protein insertase